MTTLDELTIRITADTTELKRRMRDAGLDVSNSAKKMEGSFAGLSRELKSLLPALGVGAIVSFGRNAFLAADHINDLAQRVGFAGSTLSALNIKLLQSGSNLDDFTTSMNLMNNAVGEAAKGQNKQLLQTFDDLGLSVARLKELSPEEQFFAIAAALSQIIPLIKDAKGNLRQFTDEIKRNGDALTDEQLKRIDELGDRWTESVERMKLAMLSATPALALYLDGLQAILNLPANSFKFGEQIGAAIRDRGLPAGASRVRPNTATEATTGDAAKDGIRAALKAKFGAAYRDPYAENVKNSGSGGSGGSKAVKEEAQDYDTLNGTLDEYIRNLETENSLILLNEKQREGMKAVYEAQNIAMKEGNLLSDEQIEKIKGLAIANVELNEKMQESKRFASELKDGLSSALTSIALDFDNATDSAASFAKAIASTILQRKVTGPLAEGIIGAIDGGSLFGGIGSMLGFADGGSPPVGRPSIVGERGPEIFVPNTAGTIIPNGKGVGSSSVTVINNWSFGSGVTQQQLAGLMPMMEARMKNAVFESVKRGGNEARIVGTR